MNGVEAHVLAAAADIIGFPALRARQLTRGRNNVTLLLETAGGSFIAKHYPQSPDETRDRFFSETRALDFMSRHGFDCTPTLVGQNQEARIAVMTANGTPAETFANTDDIEACIDFVRHLYEARDHMDADDLPAAAEACPAPDDVMVQVDQRRRRLEEVTNSHAELKRFLQTAFDPSLERYKARAIRILKSAGIESNDPLPRQHQTLSPSDFGLHNAVRAQNGSLVFVDFEYFGWDDPVRLVSDFLLHPGHVLDKAQKDRFTAACRSIFTDNDTFFMTRLNALYPMIGLRWGMIVLNEFLPERMARRRAAGTSEEADEIFSAQLTKATRLLADIEASTRLLNN
ncbi:hypothetical protein L2D14_02595 [Thalassospiraceae bacterium LMO-JJ14]|nr:hypothetical protein L2D14_02595 [Thalassospiraceae bacterium LMO-JJ14]